MDQKITDRWLDGFVGEAEKAGYDPDGVSQLLKVASRMQIQRRYPEAYAKGFEEFTKKAQAAPVAGAAPTGILSAIKSTLTKPRGNINLKSVLAALVGAGLLHAGSAGVRGMRQYYGVMPGNPMRWDVGDITAQNQKLRQFMNTMHGLGLGQGGNSMYGNPYMNQSMSNPYMNRPWPMSY